MTKEGDRQQKLLSQCRRDGRVTEGREATEYYTAYNTNNNYSHGSRIIDHGSYHHHYHPRPRPHRHRHRRNKNREMMMTKMTVLIS